jgi:hypothetical protein
MTDPKFLIPMIRKTMPSLIAQQIVGVQPMVGAGGSIFNMKSTYDGIKSLAQYLNKNYWPHQYTIRGMTNINEVERWCYDNVKGRNWRSLYGVFAFKHEADYAMFLLRWSQ